MIYLKSFHGIVGKKVTSVRSHGGNDHIAIIFNDSEALVLWTMASLSGAKYTINPDPNDYIKNALNLPSQREIDAAKTKEADERMQLAILKAKYETGAPS